MCSNLMFHLLDENCEKGEELRLIPSAHSHDVIHLRQLDPVLPLTYTRKFEMLYIFVAFLIPPNFTTPSRPLVSTSKRDHLGSSSS